MIIYKKIFFLLFSLFFLSNSVFADTFVDSELTTNTVWTKLGSPYIINDGLYIASGVNLHIEAGVEVKVNPDSFGIFIDGGSLEIDGVVDDKVVFDRYVDIENDFGQKWNFYIKNSTGNNLSALDLKGVDSFYIDESILSASGVIFNNFNYGFTLLGNSNLDLSDAIFDDGENTPIQIFDNSKAVISDLFIQNIYPTNNLILTVGNTELTLFHTDLVSNTDTAVLIVGGKFDADGLNISGDFLGNGLQFSSYNDGSVNPVVTIKNSSLNGFNYALSAFDTDLSIDNMSITNSFDGLDLYSGTNANLIDVTVENNEYGLNNYGANIEIKNGIYRDNVNAISSFNNSDIHIVDSEIKNNGYGISLFSALDVSIKNSSISGNISGVESYMGNDSSSIFDISNNWWGDKSGPKDIESNPNGLGDILFYVNRIPVIEPWLLSPPKVETVCCSSVIFLPGLQASRLYKKQILEDQLWEPNVLSSDIKYLYLNEDGTPKNDNIYTRDIIDRTNIGAVILDFNIYKTFIESMDKMVQDGDIDSWRAFPYDWRLDYNDIVTKGIRLQNEIEYIIPEIERMVGSSKTGKISIVTHSNGGLLAKVLIDKLKSQGEVDLIDKLIMVAPPQIGTPKAMNILLHGEEDPNLVLKRELVRGLGENMKSAYNLIPSKKYFENVLEPVVKFNSEISTISNLYSKYGSQIDSYTAMVDFLAGKDGRIDPGYSDVLNPNVLNANLINYADNVHTDIDNWQAPSNIDVSQIAGWGSLTTSGIEYFKGEDCPNIISICREFLDHRTIKTIDGDKTVVTPSAVSTVATSSKTYYLNLRSFNKDNKDSVDHSNIMEVSSLQNLIRNIITDSDSDLPDYVSNEKPEAIPYKNIRISMHSPVAIDAYDSEGNHTGLIKDPDSDNYFVEEEIPNSIYEEIGEGKYIYLDGEDRAVLKLSGLDTGTFTLQIENQENSITVSESSFVDIPTTANTEGELVFEDGQNPKLNIDVEGDGNTDIVLESGKELTPVEYLEFIKKTVNSLDINKKIKDSIIKRIEKLIKLYQKNHDKKFIKKIREFNQQLKHFAKHKGHKHHNYHSDEEIKDVVDIVNKLLDSLEQK